MTNNADIASGVAAGTSLPTSVIPVDTTIPVFIGYTEKQGSSERAVGQHIINNASITEGVKIESLAEYENIFGKCPPEQIEVRITKNTGKDTPSMSASIAFRQIHTMYYHMQLFFANGGKSCYVISVGDITRDKVIPKELVAGLKMARDYEKIMLYVFPQLEFLNAAGASEVYQAALQQAYEKNRFAIFDCFDNENPLAVREALGTRNLEFGTVYHPYLQTSLSVQYELSSLKIVEIKNGEQQSESISFEKLPELLQAKIIEDISRLSPVLPPAVAVAAAYGGVDRARGVWSAPADVVLESIHRPVVDIDTQEQMKYIIDDLTGKSLNIIRWVEKKNASVVVGARTLAGNHKYWKFISMRRLFMMVENSIRRAVKPYTASPNNVNTWVTLQGMIENYLMTLWYPRVILGAEPDKAFYVQIGLNETMTQQDIDEGRMIIEVGLAAVVPSEFIPIRIVQEMRKG